MKLPALSILIAFCSGILLAAAHPLPRWACAALCGLFFVNASLLWVNRAYRLALAVSLVGWSMLGSLGLAIEHRDRPANLVSLLIEAGRLDTSQPLRWRGILRENPEQLAWGVRFDLDLEGVQISGENTSVSGGLRVTSYGEAPPALKALEAGDRAEVLVQARLPRNFMDPGATDYRGDLSRQGVELIATLRSYELLTTQPKPPPTLTHRMARLRGNLLGRISSLLSSSPTQAAVLRAMLLGDRAFVENDVAEAFRKTSSYHVLVIAGLHVAALAAFVVWAANKLRLSRVAGSIVTLSALAAYLAVVQDRPPILRAVLMAAIYLLARTAFRRLDTLQVTALAALGIVFFRPSELADSSFQLSFLAVASIGGIAIPLLEKTAEPLRRALQHIGDVTRDPAFRPRLVQLRLDLRTISNALASRLPGWLKTRSAAVITIPMRGCVLIWETLVVSFVIQLGLLPLLVEDFHRVSIIGPLVNIPAVFLTGLIVPVGFVALAASYVSATLGHLVAGIAGRCVAALLTVVNWFAGIEWGSFRVASPPIKLILAFLFLLAFLAMAVRMRRRWVPAIAAALVTALAITLAAHPFHPTLSQGLLELTILDVGQGDSLFLAAPDGRTLLVDGGGGSGPLRVGGTQARYDIGEEVVSRYLWSRGIEKLDAVALTHAHQDHLEGLYSVLENFRVAELWVGHDVASSAYQRLLLVASANGTRIRHFERGDSFDWGGMHGHVLWPDSDAELKQASNNDSLVLRVEYGTQSLLLAGDIEKAVERTLVTEAAPLAAALLKIPHHGSATSTTDAFLGRVHPTIAAISVGAYNSFNLPSPIVIERLRAAGVEVLRTDLDGAITFITDGTTESVSTFRETPPSASRRLYSALRR
jgi:competence protein ComEC